MFTFLLADSGLVIQVSSIVKHQPSLLSYLCVCMCRITELVVEDLKSNFGEYINSIQTSMLTTIDRLENYINYPVFKNSFDFINRVYQKVSIPISCFVTVIDIFCSAFLYLVFIFCIYFFYFKILVLKKAQFSLQYKSNVVIEKKTNCCMCE